MAFPAADDLKYPLMGWGLVVLALHVFQTFAAAGAAKTWYAHRGITGNAGVPPPPAPRALRGAAPTGVDADTGGGA